MCLIQDLPNKTLKSKFTNKVLILIFTNRVVSLLCVGTIKGFHFRFKWLVKIMKASIQRFFLI